jgi:hypothetical protein
MRGPDTVDNEAMNNGRTKILQMEQKMRSRIKQVANWIMKGVEHAPLLINWSPGEDDLNL